MACGAGSHQGPDSKGDRATSFLDRFRSFFRRQPAATSEPAPPAKPGLARGRVDHVIILDGTLASLKAEHIGNAGILYLLLHEMGARANRRLYYDPGMQWQGWWRSLALLEGSGVAPQIRRAYGWLASGYRPGDRIFLFGYSRGAYAVRSLAGVIDRVGLLRRDLATERMVTQAWRHYEAGTTGQAARDFADGHCHPGVQIEMVGVWDTVKALGLPLARLVARDRHGFHNHQLGPSVRHGYHALALDETRVVLEPVLWDCPPDWQGNVQQVWFRGAHADIGGQLGTMDSARPLANIPLVWMLDRAETLGLALPEGWRERHPCDASAPMVGTWSGWGKLFLWRRRRVPGRDRSESLHPSAVDTAAGRWPSVPATD